MRVVCLVVIVTLDRLLLFETKFMTQIAFFVVAIAVVVFLEFSNFSRSKEWQATITPLASIVGSGFLVSAPLLVRSFGGFAAPAMMVLVFLAFFFGWAIRYNIVVVESELDKGRDKLLSSVEELSHIILAFAYFISVAYYLSLLGSFLLTSFGIHSNHWGTVIALGLLLGIGILGWSGGAERVARLERFATTFNLAVIGGFLASLAVMNSQIMLDGSAFSAVAGKLSTASIPVLLGLLVVVQGFETTRFTGGRFKADTRTKAMRDAQLISGIIYLVFFLLLLPLYKDLQQGEGVAAVITVAGSVGLILPAALTIAAMGSQISAALADGIGNVGLIREVTHGKVDARHAYLLVTVIGMGILLATNVNEVISLASRAFALFYALQCFVAFEAARKRPQDKWRSFAFLMLAIVATAIFMFGHAAAA